MIKLIAWLRVLLVLLALAIVAAMMIATFAACDSAPAAPSKICTTIIRHDNPVFQCGMFGRIYACRMIDPGPATEETTCQ